MKFRNTLLAALVVSAWSVSVAEAGQPVVRMNSLTNGQHLRVQTEKAIYTIQLVDVTTGESLVASSSDGTLFAWPERMFIVGATRGPQPHDGGFSVVLAGEIQEGLRIEWGQGSLDEADRGLTSTVKSIEVLPLDRVARR